MGTLLTLLLLFNAPAAPADTVIFFGGYKAKKSQVDCWAAGARAAASAHSFLAYPWPEGVNTTGPEAADTPAAMRMITGAVHRILTEKAKFYLAGHSSGAALANKTARLALARDPGIQARLRLVALDGFAPRDLFNKVETLCVSAVSANGTSRNHASMQSCPHHWAYRDLRPQACLDPWCHHFVILSKAVPPDLGNRWPTHGYNGCETDANVDWLLK